MTHPDLCSFFFIDTAHTEISPLSLHDALPISRDRRDRAPDGRAGRRPHPASHPHRALHREPLDVGGKRDRSEEHTSELQSHHDLVCRLLLEKKKQKKKQRLSTKENKARARPEL